jgi:uncharacterized protein (DUF1330 family)
MQYLVVGRPDRSAYELAPDQGAVIADGEMVSLEQEWILGAPLIARLKEGVGLDDIRAQLPAGCNAFAVEGMREPTAGEAFILGAHTMRDISHFRTYAERVGEVVERFGGRFLVRANEVTPIAGNVVPNRVVITEYPRADDAVAYYVSDAYAPLLKLRLATANTRLVVLARHGALPASARGALEHYLRRHRGASHGY